jgi:hypothetical protein
VTNRRHPSSKTSTRRRAARTPREGPDARTIAIVIPPPSPEPPTVERQLENAFLRWAWEAGYRRWEDAVRALARTLRGLERTGFIERHVVRRPGARPRHGFTLTEDGVSLLETLTEVPTGGNR